MKVLKARAHRELARREQQRRRHARKHAEPLVTCNECSRPGSGHELPGPGESITRYVGCDQVYLDGCCGVFMPTARGERVQRWLQRRAESPHAVVVLVPGLVLKPPTAGQMSAKVGGRHESSLPPSRFVLQAQERRFKDLVEQAVEEAKAEVRRTRAQGPGGQS